MYTDPTLWVLPVREGHFADVETEPREVSDLFKVAQLSGKLNSEIQTPSP